MSKNGIFIAITCLLAGSNFITAGCSASSQFVATVLIDAGLVCVVMGVWILVAMIRERDQR